MEALLRTVRVFILFTFACFMLSCDSLQEMAGVLTEQEVGYGSRPTPTEVSSGLKQALDKGVNSGVSILSKRDAFLKDQAIKILFPPEARKVERTLRDLGLNALCDNVVSSLNHAAENAMNEARPVFVAAIKEMTISDAMNILMGGENAATAYFKSQTSAELKERFKPHIQMSLNKVGATRYWTEAAGHYNKIPLVKPIETDLSAYVAERAIAGLFKEIAKEELKIRASLNARTTPLLKKVFGYAERIKAD